MMTALWRQAHLIPKLEQLLARLSPRRDVYVLYIYIYSVCVGVCSYMGFKYLIPWKNFQSTWQRLMRLADFSSSSNSALSADEKFGGSDVQMAV